MRITPALVLTGVAMLAACSGSPGSPSSTTGTLNVRLTDSPFSDAKAVLVTFTEVSAHRDTDEGFMTVPFAGGGAARTCDLKKLEGADDVLGVGTLPEGHYTQVRLLVSAAALYFDAATDGPACAATIPAPDGASAAVEIPSGEVKLNRQFQVQAGGATTMTLDFDGDQSIRETGNGAYRMTPVIAVMSVQ